MKADKVEWNQTKDILTATGAVKVVKDDMLAEAEKIIFKADATICYKNLKEAFKWM